MHSRERFMHLLRYRLACSILVSLLMLSAGGASAQVNVLTERYDAARSGANLAETTLTTTNVNQAQFGKLWSYAVDGSVYAQPLYVSGVTIPAVGIRNVLYVVTMNDVVYAFDADSAVTLWSRDLRNPTVGVSPVPIVDITGNLNNRNIVGVVGIESTPVIDPVSHILYLVARTKENGSYVQRLHAFDITTGAEQPHSPVTILGSVNGSGDGGSTVIFNPETSNQRASLALANGQIYIAWSSHEDFPPWHGWVMTYDKTALNQTGILCITPDGSDGGVWMGGRAPAVDAAGNVYYMVGNGDWNGTSNFGESFIKLGAPNAGRLRVSDYFTPDDWTNLNGPDLDLGSSGPLLIPLTDLIVGGGKGSQLYLTSTANLGQLTTGNAGIVQTIVVNSPPDSSDLNSIRAGGPVYWNRSGGVRPCLYVWADSDYLKAYRFNGATFDTPPISQSTTVPQGYGGVIALSANGSTPDSGIVWASMPARDDGQMGLAHGLLRALDADHLSTELWNSDQNPPDNLGYWPKFSAPTVVNGRVYLASQSGYVSAYGLLPTMPYFALSASVPVVPAPMPSGEVDPGPVAVANPGGSPAYTIATTAGAGFSGNIALSVSSALPPGTVASWSPASVVAGDSAVLTLGTSSSTPVGSYELTVSGTDGGKTQSTGIVLVIQPPRTISLEFWTANPSCTPDGMGTTEVAGVVAKPYWNNNEYNIQPSPGGLATPAPLNDETGASTGAWASWTANGESLNPNIPDTPGNDRLMRCYLDPAVGSSAVVTISNLPANSGGYDVYVYADGNNGSSARTGTYSVSGPGITTASINVTDAANANFSGTFVRASNSNPVGNYALLPIDAGAAGFTLTATPVGGSGAAPINGLQIVPDRIFANGFD
jgi:hypothetical protein